MLTLLLIISKNTPDILICVEHSHFQLLNPPRSTSLAGKIISTADVICTNISLMVFKQAPVGREDRSTFTVTRILKQINAVAAITPVGCHHTLSLVERKKER